MENDRKSREILGNNGKYWEILGNDLNTCLDMFDKNKSLMQIRKLWEFIDLDMFAIKIKMEIVRK